MNATTTSRRTKQYLSLADTADCKSASDIFGLLEMSDSSEVVEVIIITYTSMLVFFQPLSHEQRGRRIGWLDAADAVVCFERRNSDDLHVTARKRWPDAWIMWVSCLCTSETEGSILQHDCAS